jgi:chromosome segregation ATPase
MPTTSDKATTSRAAAGLLSTLRDVLFETTPNGVAKVSTISAPPPASTSADLEAARLALQQGLEAATGPGVREFALQVEALREVLPDAKQRQRAAMRVLALKGISPPALAAELQHAIACLGAQREAFFGKLAARRASIEQQRGAAVETCKVETAEAEQAIARLQGELDAARAALAAAGARREQALGDCDENAQRLAAKQLCFERAFSELHGEYATLEQQLSNAETA